MPTFDEYLSMLQPNPEQARKQAMWQALNAARHQVLAHLGRAPRITVVPQDYCAAA